jgi:hypothetical protein
MSIYGAMDLAILTVSGGPMYAGEAHSVLHYYISDLILGLDPWLDNTTACTFPTPWANATDDRNYFTIPNIMADADGESSRVDDITTDYKEGWFDAYVGQYGHLFFGNITISHDDVTDKLRFEAGKFGIGFLTPDGSLPGKMLLTFDESLSYVHWLESSLGVYPPILFTNQDNTTGLYQELLALLYDPVVPPTFLRDLMWDDTE